MINEIVLSGLSEIVKKTIKICAEMYNFDANEAMSKIGIEELMEKEVRKRDESEKKVEKKKERKEKTEIPLPYNGELNEDCCKGVKHNYGLYTQCRVKSKNGEKYCKMCENQAMKHSHGKPTYGTMEDRLAVGIMEFVDPSGKKPEMYMNVLKKMNIPINEAVDEAKKQKMQINEVHFEEEADQGIVISEKVVEKTKGRPKKSRKVLEVAPDEDDLINSLLIAAKEKQSTEEEEEKKKQEEAVKETEKKKKEEEEQAKKKEAKKAAKEADKKKKEQEEEQAKMKEAMEKKAEMEKKEQEELAKKKKQEDQEVVPEGYAKVKKFTYKDGNKYLRSAVGIVYNIDQKEVGKWNELTGEIEFKKIKEDEEKYGLLDAQKTLDPPKNVPLPINIENEIKRSYTYSAYPVKVRGEYYNLPNVFSQLSSTNKREFVLLIDSSFFSFSTLRKQSIIRKNYQQYIQIY
jgi:chemotaxis protein histidine kinase CheA